MNAAIAHKRKPARLGAQRNESRSPVEAASDMEGWTALLERVHLADNLSLMRRLPDGCCDLIYADPPFHTGRARRGVNRSTGSPALFPDGSSTTRERYLVFLCERFEQMRRLLSNEGSLYVHVDFRLSGYVRVMLDELFGPDALLNEIIWCYRTGGRTGRHFARKHDTIFLYARCPGKHYFHLPRHGRYRTDGLKCDARGRPYKQTQRGRLYFHCDGPAMSDVWDIPFLSTVSHERTGYPTQKPLALLERIITASSRPGAVVGDFFCGSGTTLVVARNLGRRWIGCDWNESAVRIARARLRE